ncbi:DUF2948 family protein [Kiloniella antarctica]|uniref:DUF2948 family protein n=1 Tax=Kiloniella antarctica TaxID=1550907 RepID=A0ABW5BS45_9PROT
MAESKRLKIRAHDAEDIRTLSGLLQDSLAPLCDVTYLREQSRFVLVVNRFCWEMLPTEIRERALSAPDTPAGQAENDDVSFDDVEDLPTFHRVNTGLCFDKVKSVQVKDVDLSKKDEILNLLTVAAIPGYITLHFSGGAAIRLVVSQIRCHMDDISEPWPTLYQPRHDMDGISDTDGKDDTSSKKDHSQDTEHSKGARSPEEA